MGNIGQDGETGGNFKNLLVWQKAFDLCLQVYRVTASFPEEERYGLASQMRRAGASVPANVAEGRARTHPQEYAQFLNVAFGSAAELETFLLLALELHYVTDDEYYRGAVGMLAEVKRMLSGLRKSVLARGRQHAARSEQGTTRDE
jgi:four helix bundle protein